MRYREFLRELLKSVRKGRIHYLLRFLLVSAFVLLSAISLFDISKYLVREKANITLIKKNFRWGFDWKDKILWASADSIFLKSPGFELELSKVKVDLDVLKTLKSLTPTVSSLRLESGRLFILERRGKKKNLRFPKVPVKIENLEISSFALISKDVEFLLNGIKLDNRSISSGGLEGKVFGKDLWVSPFSGFKENNLFRIPSVSFSYNGCSGQGSVAFKGFEEAQSNLELSCPYYLGKLTVKKYGKSINVVWKGSSCGKRTYGEGELLFTETKVKIESLRGSFENTSFRGSGELKGDRVIFSGRIHGSTLKFREIKFVNFNSQIEVKGNIKGPEVRVTGEAEKLGTPILDLSRIKATASISPKRKFNVSFSSKAIRGSLSGKLSNFEGNFFFKNLKINEFKRVRSYRSKYGKWIPSLEFSGDLKLRRDKRGLTYRGTFSLKRFYFRGYAGIGNLNISGNRESLNFSGKISGKDGTVESKGSINLRKLTIDSEYKGGNLSLNSLDFLRSLGLKGKVRGGGKLYGSLKNPKGQFSFSSKAVYLFNQPLNEVNGEVRLKDFYLNISAFAENLFIDRLSVHLKHPISFFLSGKVQEISSEKVLGVLKGYRVKLPFKLKGSVSGSFKIEAKDVKRRDTYTALVYIDRFHGSFSNEILSATGVAAGSISYFNSELLVNLTGKLENGIFNGQKFNGVIISFSIFKNNLSVKFERVRPVIPPVENVLSGSLEVNLKSNEVLGEFTSSGSGRWSVGSLNFKIGSRISGLTSKFVVEVSGNSTFNSPFLGKPVNLRIFGSLMEPQNVGVISLEGENSDLKLVVNGAETQVVGTVKNLNLRGENLKGVINLAFVNINLNNLSGTLAIPTFRVKPESFFPLYSVSGIYIRLENGKIEIEDFSLSFIDGWIRFKNLRVRKLSGISGEFESSLGVKGLVYLFKLNKFINYARNDLHVTGSFSYGRELSYRLSVAGKDIEIKSKFLLEKLVFRELSTKFRNGGLEDVKAVADTGIGNVIALKTNGGVSITLSSVPLGSIGSWKGEVSGKLLYTGSSLEGKLSISKVKVFLNKEKQTTVQTPVKVPISINVDLLFDEPVELKGELFSIKIIPRLHLKTRNGRPVIEGDFVATEGKINYMGKMFEILYGFGTIENLEAKEGTINILASSNVSGYFIYMKIEGSLKSPAIYLTSDPPLTREQILNLIMTGASPEEIEASSEIFPAVQVAYYATASLFKPVEETFKKALKVENFSIEPYITKYGETVAKLNVVKVLTKRVKLFGYGTTGQNPEYGGGVQLRLSKKYFLELRYNSFYGAEFGVGIELERR